MKVFTVQIHELGRCYRDIPDPIIGAFQKKEDAMECIRESIQGYFEDSDERVEVTLEDLSTTEYSQDDGDGNILYGLDFSPDGFFYFVRELELK